ncbi:MAG: hypothetical protein ABFD46_01505 [Armatimonadota bacterium]
MHDTYERRTERKFCYFIKDYVDAALVIHKWMLIDNTWQEEEVSFECRMARKCRKSEYNCQAIHPESGKDPFVPPRNLLADMW